MFDLNNIDINFFLSSITSGLIVIDNNLNIKFINEYAQNIFGIQDENLVEKKLTEVIINKFFIESIKNCLNRKKGVTRKVIKIKLNNTKYYIGFTVSVLLENNESIGLIINLSDITENHILSQNLIKSYNQLKDTQKQMIRAERLAAAGELAAGVSHEIKNRFQVISNALSYIEKKIDMSEEGIKINFNYIKSEVKRGVELINDLMDFSKPHSLSKKMVDINEIIKSCFPLIKKQLEKKNISYNENLTNISETYADYNMIQQVIMNIMKNAEESLENSGELDVITESVTRDNIDTIFDLENSSVYDNYILIKISDTGAGIKEKNISKIFTPFFSTKEPGKGTGLGLSVSNSIIEEHNGFIEVESEKNKGTCFYIYLPVTEAYEK